MSKVKYSHVKGLKDITDINNQIRTQVRKAKTKRKLESLRKESQYLIALVDSPAWSDVVKGRKLKFRAKTKAEYRKTEKLINSKLK